MSADEPRKRPTVRERENSPNAGSEIRPHEDYSRHIRGQPGYCRTPSLRIHEAFHRLVRSPGIGYYHEELLNRRYRFWNFYSYVVCYSWEKKPIQIIAVVHGARDLASFLSTRDV